MSFIKNSIFGTFRDPCHQRIMPIPKTLSNHFSPKPKALRMMSSKKPNKRKGNRLWVKLWHFCKNTWRRKLLNGSWKMTMSSAILPKVAERSLLPIVKRFKWVFIRKSRFWKTKHAYKVMTKLEQIRSQQKLQYFFYLKLHKKSGK